MNKTIKRIAIFAAYEKDEIVQDYVIYYLEFLRKTADYIIVVYDNFLPPDEIKKLLPYTEHVIAQRHGEYDFGSYKRGYQYAANNNLLQNYDELILCNDSCFCYNDITPCFDNMAEKNYDFWGMTECEIFAKHLQSWFLVLKQKVFLSDIFLKFILSVEKKDNYIDVVKSYEIALTEILASNNFKYGSVNGYCEHKNPIFYPLDLYKNQVYFLKKKCFCNYFFVNTSLKNALQLDKILQKNNKIYKAIKKYFKLKNSISKFIILNKFKLFFFEKTDTAPNGIYKIKIFRLQIWKGKKK